MAPSAGDDGSLEAALREERELVLSLGGYAVELPGGVLVVNERIPVPRFNFIQYVRLHRNRQSAFFERALDHYFQRALRPSIRVEQPVEDFLDATLRRLGFRPTPHPWSLLLRRRAPTPLPSEDRYEVRTARGEELPLLARFWAGESETEEFLRALSVALEHPNPEEQLRPAVALRNGAPVSAALLHTYRSSAGIHGVVTQPSERGQGAATALVAGLTQKAILPPTTDPIAMWSDSSRLETRLGGLGFDLTARFVVYELPRDAELAWPSATAPATPRWRPTRHTAVGAG
ncbi:MAG: GNAT family N-acetyltransferase [Thermoplasmata archaeon]|nr:GNAT family N-acetyltransferase [Thermoplasmata archaeon]